MGKRSAALWTTGALLAFVFRMVVGVPKMPSELTADLDSKSSSLNYYIFLKIWSNQPQDDAKEACSIVIPADSSFDFSYNPMNKQQIVKQLSEQSFVSGMIRRATSPDVFRLSEDQSSTKGKLAVDKSTFVKPAFAESYDGYKITTWKSLRDGAMLVNGAKVVFQKKLSKNCHFVVTESFPFARPQNFFTFIIEQIQMER